MSFQTCRQAGLFRNPGSTRPRNKFRVTISILISETILIQVQEKFRLTKANVIMKIAVLLSGGVDSSVALKLLKDEGHDLTAFYLKIWLQDEFSFLANVPGKRILNTPAVSAASLMYR